MAKAYLTETQTRAKRVDFAEIKVFTEKNRVESEFPLFARAKFDVASIEGDHLSFTAYLRTVTLALNVENLGEVVTKGNYAAHLEESKVRFQTKSGSMETRESRWQIFAAIRGRLGASGSAAASEMSRAHEQDSAEATSTISLVGPLSNLKWRIGHRELGDPRNPGCALEGPYLIEKRLPLCHLAVDRGAASARIVATVSVRRGDMYVVTDRRIWRDPEISTGEEPEFAHTLQSKLHSIRLMKSLVPSGSWVIARDVLDLVPEPDATE